MNYFYTVDKLKIDPTTGEKLVGKNKFKGVFYPPVLHSATQEDAVSLADSYNELMDKEKQIAEEMIWTEVEEDGVDEENKSIKIKRMLSVKEWKTGGKPLHGVWYPRHVWLGVDPGFDKEKATTFAEGKEKILAVNL